VTGPAEIPESPADTLYFAEREIPVCRINPVFRQVFHGIGVPAWQAGGSRRCAGLFIAPAHREIPPVIQFVIPSGLSGEG
jgi:hypothetical protein